MTCSLGYMMPPQWMHPHVPMPNQCGMETQQIQQQPMGGIFVNAVCRPRAIVNVGLSFFSFRSSSRSEFWRKTNLQRGSQLLPKCPPTLHRRKETKSPDRGQNFLSSYMSSPGDTKSSRTLAEHRGRLLGGNR